MGFSSRLVKAREYRRMSQADLAKRAKFHVSAINHFERGRREPSLSNLVRLAFALSVTTDFLVGMGTGEVKEMAVTR